MKNYKSTIIKKYGTKVEVQRYLGDMPTRTLETRVLLGRATRTNTNLRTAEYQKEAIFLPDFDVDSGDFIINKQHGEDYIVVTTLKEYDGDSTLSIVANAMKCSHRMTLKGNTKVADNRGNLKTILGDKYKDVPCYLEHVSSQLLQYDPGLSPETKHFIYTTDLNIELTDQIVIKVGQRESLFKVEGLDYTSFPNLVVIEISEDLRK